MMRFSPTFLALALGAAFSAAALAQDTTSNLSSAPRSALPSGLSFSYDAAHGQISAAGLRVAPSPKAPTVSPVTGTIVITINIKVVSSFEGGTTYHCSVYAIGGALDLAAGTVEGGIENVNTFAVASTPGNETCTLTIPYEWTLTQGSGVQNGLILAYGVGAINPEEEVQHSTLQVDGIENLSANGTTEKFTFNVTL
jgi:hypothetical protein